MWKWKKRPFLFPIKLLPYLFIAFIVLELFEHKLSKKNERLLVKNKKYGPIIGGILGALPQCGFSTMASSLYSSRVITIGTVIAIFLSTSDEMLPIMLSEKVNLLIILKIIGFKVLIGILIGILIDIIYRERKTNLNDNIHDMCEHDNCHCKEEGILISSIKHTLKIALFILIANILISYAIYFIGEEKLSSILTHNNILTYFLASLIGLIPNCASSVIMTELYLSNIISIGILLSGLLPGSGLGILILFKSNKNLKENIFILSVIYIVGVTIGIIVDTVI